MRTVGQFGGSISWELVVARERPNGRADKFLMGLLPRTVAVDLNDRNGGIAVIRRRPNIVCYPRRPLGEIPAYAFEAANWSVILHSASRSMS